MSKPKYYKLGIKNKCFNVYQFSRWFGYALVQSAMLIFMSYQTFDGSIQKTEKEAIRGSLIMNGTFLVEAIVILVNVKIYTSTYNHTFFSILF